MAVLAYRGDLRRLSCDAWYLPCDVSGYVGRGWTVGDPELEAAVRGAADRLPPGWGRQGARVLEVPLDGTRAVPVLAAIPTGGTGDWQYHRETLKQFVELAAGLDRPGHLAAGPGERSRRLLAVPLIGTGLSAWKPDRAGHLRGLLQALHEESAAHDVDLVVVVRGTTDRLWSESDADAHWSALQALRRRRLLEVGPDPELVPLLEPAQRLADLALAGRLVLFTGAGIGLPAGLPDWKGLLRELAVWAGYDDAQVERLGTMDLLDQAALVDSKRPGQLADRVAERLTAPHHALAHGLLVNLPVRENVTLNYDQLLECAAEVAGRDLAVLPYEPADERWLLKLHGDVAPDRRDDIVLTRADYLSLANHRATLTGLVQALLVTRHMLFVGFGLADAHLHAVVHDVKRALVGARSGELGTALLLETDDLQQQLWAGDLEHVPMGEGTWPDRARRLELFLDHVLLLSTTSDAHLFEASFDEVLTPAERSVRDALRSGLDGVPLTGSSTGARVAALLAELGWVR